MFDAWKQDEGVPSHLPAGPWLCRWLCHVGVPCADASVKPPALQPELAEHLHAFDGTGRRRLDNGNACTPQHCVLHPAETMVRVA